MHFPLRAGAYPAFQGQELAVLFRVVSAEMHSIVVNLRARRRRPFGSVLAGPLLRLIRTVEVPELCQDLGLDFGC